LFLLKVVNGNGEKKSFPKRRKARVGVSQSMAAGVLQEENCKATYDKTGTKYGKVGSTTFRPARGDDLPYPKRLVLARGGGKKLGKGA